MSKVFVPTNPMRLNQETGLLEPRFDLRPAEEFGELVFLLSPSANPMGPARDRLVDDLYRGLEAMTPEDYILLVGSPLLLSLTSVVAFAYLDTIQWLQWSGKEGRYNAVSFDMADKRRPDCV